MRYIIISSKWSNIHRVCNECVVKSVFCGTWDTMERFDAEIWELTFLRVNIKMMGLFGAWYSTRLPHRVLDNLLAIWVKYLQFSYGISILGFTLYFFKPMEDDIYEYYFTILLIFNIYFNTSEYAMFLFRRPLFAKIIQMMEDYLRFNCQLFGKEVSIIINCCWCYSNQGSGTNPELYFGGHKIKKQQHNFIKNNVGYMGRSQVKAINSNFRCFFKFYCQST